MSDYGLVLCNCVGKIQIDGEHKNFVYQEHGTWTRNRSGEGSSGSDVEGVSFSTAISSGVPIVALRPEGESVGFCACTKSLIKSGSSYTGFNLKWEYSSSPDDDGVDWVVFRPILNTEAVSGDYGMNVYNSDGDLIWCSSAKAMKLVGGVGANLSYYSGITPEDAVNNYFFVYPPYKRYVYGGSYWPVMWNCFGGTLTINSGSQKAWETSDETELFPILMEVKY